MKTQSDSKASRLTRRTCLLGAGGATLALPFLHSLHKSSAQAAPQPGYAESGRPLRFVVWFTPNGTIGPRWRPSGSGADFELSPILAPLESHRDKILIIDGLDQTGTGGDGHHNGFMGLLTGDDITSAGAKKVATNISVDQYLADALGKETAFPSLELGVQSGGHTMSWKGANIGVKTDNDPRNVLERVFPVTPNEPDPSAELKLARERRVVSSVIDDYRQLKRRLPINDAHRLEAHLEAVESLERRLDQGQSGGTSCSTPSVNGGLDHLLNENFPDVGRAQTDLLVMALACDLTRVGSIMWEHSTGQAIHHWVDPAINRGHHDMSHDGDSNTDTQDKLTAINRWYAEQFSYFLEQLDSIPEGDGTLLDHTVVFWGNELAVGNRHTKDNTHYVVAGGGGHFKLGQYVAYDAADEIEHNNLLVEFVRAMGLQDESFGRPEWCKRPLHELLLNS